VLAERNAQVISIKKVRYIALTHTTRSAIGLYFVFLGDRYQFFVECYN